ncbi:MAG TPA: hypothetical protein VGF98_14640 [Candidatus Tumulicola sp.]|jgi:hypothetical protein
MNSMPSTHTLYVTRLEPGTFDLNHPLDPETAEEVRAAVTSLRTFINDHMLWAVVLVNYQVLRSYLDQNNAELSARRTLHTSQQIDQMLLEVNRHLMNFLSSVRTYIDVMPQRLANRPDVRSGFARWTGVQYDAHFAYRLFENLRNVAQHGDLPVRAFSWDAQATEGTAVINFSLAIDRDAFLEARRMQPRVRREVELLDANIALEPNLIQYFDSLGLVQLQLTRSIIQIYANAGLVINAALERVGNPREVAMAFVQVDSVQGNRMDFTVLDAHLHGAIMAIESRRAIDVTDFSDVDRALAEWLEAHPGR